MSAGVFETGKYEAASGAFVYECRVQPETKGLTLNSVANEYPAASATADLPTLTLSQSRRGFGVKPRTVTIELTADGTAETGDYLGTGSRLTIPVFQQSVWEGYSKGQTGTYLDIACVFASKNPELIR